MSWLDRPLLGLRFLSGERAIFIGILLVAILLRFWDLGYRILHHDESIHAVWSWYLYMGRGYRHDPVYHGPFLYHFEAFIYFLIGATDYATRVGPAIFGTILVALPYLLRSRLGRTGALSASFLLMLSPSVLYYSRSLRHDIFAATATLALVVAMWRYMEEGQPRWIYMAAAALALGFTTHELTYITVAIVAGYLLVTAGLGAARALRQRRPQDLSPAASYLLFLATIVAPLGSAMSLVVLHPFGLQYTGPAADSITWIALIALLVFSALLGTWWNRRVWLGAAAIFWVIFVVLYTSIFSNPDGFYSGAVGALRYWLTQQSFARGGQPWYYYMLLFPLYDFLPLIFGLAGGVYAIWRRHAFGLFLLYWSLASFAMYSWAGEKMPWLVIHIAIPFCMLAGWYLNHLLGSIRWREAWARGGAYFVVVLGLLFSVFLALSNLGWPGTGGMPLQQQQRLFPWLALFGLWVGLLVAAYLLIRRLGWLRSWQMVGMAALTLMLAFTFHSSLTVNFRNGDIPVEMLVYTQSSPDVGKVMREIERVAFRTGTGKEIKVAYDDKVSWPFEWYLRDYTAKNYYGNGLPANDAPVVLVGLEGDHDARVKAALGNRYVGQRYKLRWWFPEDYKSPYDWMKAMQSDEGRARFPATNQVSTGFFDIMRATFQPSGIQRLWKYFLYRDTFNPLGSTDFMLYIRKDLVDNLWAVSATAAPATIEDDQYASKARVLAAAQTIGAPGAGDGQLAEPKGIAIGPDGSIYVADSRNNRVEKFDASGNFVTKWGSSGNANGQFAEPWGIATDGQGNVYVADTWNHRIQKFDKNGNFLLTWGTGISANQGEFYGPRGIAVDAGGNVYVTDAGNHRIQKFDGEGRFLAAYGSRGDAEGQFAEPVGIAVDRAGNIYVADTWNQRVQRLDADLRPTGQWPVAGWQTQSLLNKPYLTVDSEGNVYASDPDNHRMLQFSSTGSIRAVWGKLGIDATGMNVPTGVALDASGNIYITDSLNGRILKFPPLK
ncbi:MAG: TIGR03663 family protein [Chloroflexi bacterium]|nr:TIGR03663 family protein [Chloroflexota bacterium]